MLPKHTTLWGWEMGGITCFCAGTVLQVGTLAAPVAVGPVMVYS